jgi:hypothetical protein
MAADSPGVEVPVMEVEMTTLDSFVSERTVRPNVILIDVEGAEVRVLEGGRETIRSARPTLLVEVHWLQDSVRGFYERELVPLGYTALDLNWEPYRFQGEPRRDHVVLIPGSARSE